MKNESKLRKKVYSAPTLTKLAEDKAKKFVAERTNCSDEEAQDVLESLREEQQDSNKEVQKKADRKVS
jgi:vacuolar-type H+-ATPase subunit H